MDPLWEYRWAFIETGHWGGRKETNFFMTDAEAERWWAFGRPGTERLESTKRDRTQQSIDWNRTEGVKSWNHGGVSYD